MADAHTVSVLLKLRDEVSGGLRKAKGELDTFGKSVQSHQKVFRQTGLALSAMGAVGAAGMALATRSFVQFEQQLANAGAVAGATEAQMESMSNVARELGRTTVFTASQSAEALAFLARAGFQVEEATQALPGVLQLAAAAQIDLARAADITSNVLAGYGFEVKELARVNDVLTKAFTSANTDLNQLGEALKFAGPVASAAGVAFEETSAALALMGNAGIQATMAGTALRGAIAKMLSPTDEANDIIQELGLNFTDTAGNLLPLVDIIKQLETAGLSAGQGMELFGLRAGPAMLALVSQGSDALEKLTGELNNAGGTAQEIADRQLATLGGQLTLLKSALEGVLIEIGAALAPVISNVASALAGLAESLASVDPRLIQIAVGVAAAGAAFALIAGPILLFLGFLPTIAAGATAAAGAFVVFKTALVALGTATAGPLGLVIAAVSLLAVGLGRNLSRGSTEGSRQLKMVGQAAVEAGKGLSALEKTNIENRIQGITAEISNLNDEIASHDIDSFSEFAKRLFIGDNAANKARERARQQIEKLREEQDGLNASLAKHAEIYAIVGASSNTTLTEITGAVQELSRAELEAQRTSFDGIQTRLKDTDMLYQDTWASTTAAVQGAMDIQKQEAEDLALFNGMLRTNDIAETQRVEDEKLRIISSSFQEWRRMAIENASGVARLREQTLLAGLGFTSGNLSTAMNFGHVNIESVMEGLQKQLDTTGTGTSTIPMASGSGGSGGGGNEVVVIHPDSTARHMATIADLHAAYAAGEIGDIFTYGEG